MISNNQRTKKQRKWDKLRQMETACYAKYNNNVINLQLSHPSERFRGVTSMLLTLGSTHKTSKTCTQNYLRKKQLESIQTAVLRLLLL